MPQLPNIHFKHETGAMGLALDPDWAKGDTYIYVYYGSTTAGSMILSRFTHNEGTGNLASTAAVKSELILWKDTDGWGTEKGTPLYHYGGNVLFGPDNHLYLPLGDKYTETMQKSSKHYAGCIVRVTKTGGIPEGNLPTNIKPEACWAYGIRNGYSSYWQGARF
jgi:glucose/arabinose dehydrogenase